MICIYKEQDYKKVLSTAQIAEGTAIINLTGKILLYSTKYSVQLNKLEHLHPNDINERMFEELVWPYLNHSCNANTFVDTKKLQLIALRTILPKEEITFDYETTEINMSEPFQCNCKSINCRGLIKGNNAK